MKINKNLKQVLKKKNGIDVKKVINEYLADCRYPGGLSQETIRGYRQVLETFINPKIMPEVKSVKDLVPEIMREFFKRLETRKREVGRGEIRIGIKQSTRKTYWSKLNSFFVWLVLNGYIEKNPFDQMKKPDEPVYDDKRSLEDDEIDQIIAAVHNHSKNTLILRRDIAMLSVLMYCGLRKTEMRLLQVKDVDWERRLLTVRAETSKSGETRRLRMHPTLLMHLQEYVDERKKRGYKTPHLFVSNNGDRTLSAHGLIHWIRRLVSLSGVKFHLHRFRHTFAIKLEEQNVGITKIQKLMGHKKLRMTQRYLRSKGAEDFGDEIDKLSY